MPRDNMLIVEADHAVAERQLFEVTKAKTCKKEGFRQLLHTLGIPHY